MSGIAKIIDEEFDTNFYGSKIFSESLRTNNNNNIIIYNLYPY